MTPKPMCIIVTGRPGAGKTTLAKQLGRRLYLPVIHRDEIKEGYVNTFGRGHDRLPDTTNQAVTDFFFAVVQQYLSNQVSVIAEAAFQHRLWAHGVPIWVPLSRVSVLICTVDAGVAAQRHLRRGLQDANREFYHGDASVTAYKATGVLPLPDDYVPPRFDVPTLMVSTRDGYEPDLEAIADFVCAADQQRR